MENSFRSETILEKILDVYMQSMNEYQRSGGWDTYYRSYSLNPRGKFIMFPKITLCFFKSQKLKTQYQKVFNEKSNTSVHPRTKKALRTAVKNEILRRVSARNSYGNPYGCSFTRLQEIYLDTFKVDVQVEFKLKDTDSETYIDKFYRTATSKKLAFEKCLHDVLLRNTGVEILSYRVIN